MKKYNIVIEKLIDPKNGSKFSKIEEDKIIFENNDEYPISNNIPILIDEDSSLFTFEDILNKRDTTQSKNYRNSKVFKNYVRKNIPSLSKDSEINSRYKNLKANLIDGPILVIGAGDKHKKYKQCFGNEVILSDVHMQFNVDIVFDCHKIPYQDDTFSLIVLPQVLEHTSKPWIVASEIERVVKNGGFILVEVPFIFPFHGLPYDYYRFTPEGLKVLFSNSKIEKLQIIEGEWSSVAIILSNAIVNLFKNRLLRIFILFINRFLFFWIKYLDKIKTKSSLTSPKGIITIFKYHNKSINAD